MSNPYASPSDAGVSFRQRIRQKEWLVSIGLLLAATAAGWLIWACSQAITGEAEPWDSASFYYPISLFVSGFVLSAFCLRLWWLVPIALMLGQITFMEFQYHPTTAEILPSLIAVAVFATIPSMAGSCLGWLMRRRVRVARTRGVRWNRG